MESSAALITLRDGKRYAASSYEFRDGWLHIVGRRFVKVGLNNETTRFCGTLGTRSWPREAVAEVRAVESPAEASEGVSAASCAS